MGEARLRCQTGMGKMRDRDVVVLKGAPALAVLRLAPCSLGAGVGPTPTSLYITYIIGSRSVTARGAAGRFSGPVTKIGVVAAKYVRRVPSHFHEVRTAAAVRHRGR